jgi:adenosylcobinamide kinase/adenosylcobinamide-phosphate guanylyltransferase
MAKVILITGGARSGKSSFAQECAEKYSEKRIFIATAQPFDAEMEQRIARHKVDRGDKFETIEAPFDLAAALRHTPVDTSVILLDCMTVWVGNLLYRYENDFIRIGKAVEAFTAALINLHTDVVIVTNEVGMGIVPDNPLVRQFRDLAGNLNRSVAGMADEVYLCVCGLPVKIKD